jgi:ActR/RegA family two-component response regulator
MISGASNSTCVVATEQGARFFARAWNYSKADRVCLVLSKNQPLIRRVAKAATKRSFHVDDFTDIQEAAVAALFSPPALAVLDLALGYEHAQFDPLVALCRQLVTERTTQLALVGYADDEREEKLFRQLGATYYFPELPSLEDFRQLAIGAASHVRACQQDATTELLRRASQH